MFELSEPIKKEAIRLQALGLNIQEIIQELRKTFENELADISDLELQELIEDLFASHENKPKEVKQSEEIEQSEEIKQSEEGKRKRCKP